MAKIFEYDGVVIGAGHNGMICAALSGQVRPEDHGRREKYGSRRRAGLPRGPQLSRLLAQHSFGISSRFDDAAVVQGSRAGEFRHSLLPARSRRRASFPRQDLSRLVRRREEDGRDHRAIFEEGRGDVHGHLDALAAGGRENRLPGNLRRAVADRRETAAAGKTSRRTRVFEIFRHHAGGIRSATFRASARARFHRLFSASCAATSSTRRRPDI